MSRSCTVLDTVELVSAREGDFVVDWPAVRRIVASANRGALINANSSKVPLERESLMERIFNDPVYVLEVNWDAIRRVTDMQTEAEMFANRDLLIGHSISMADYRAKLRDDWVAAAKEKQLFRAKQRQVSREAARTIQENVGTWETATSIAKVTRDVSFGAVIVGGVVISGGTGVALVGAGSVGKGFGKGQDVYYESTLASEQRLGAAVASGTIEATMSFATAFIPAGGTASKQAAVLFLDLKTTFAQSLVEGKSVEDALLDAGWKTASFGAGKAIPKSVSDRMRNMAFPVLWKLGGKNSTFVGGSALKSSVKMSRELGDHVLGETKNFAVGQVRKQIESKQDEKGSPQIVTGASLGGDMDVCDLVLRRAIVQVSQRDAL